MQVLPETCTLIRQGSGYSYKSHKIQRHFQMDREVSKVIRTSEDMLILVKAQVDKPFILTTDASDAHVGGVICQTQSDGTSRPVGYFSKK